MCSICATCIIMCHCPRCPLRKEELVPIKSCSVCGIEDDRTCKDPICAVIEHCLTDTTRYEFI